MEGVIEKKRGGLRNLGIIWGNWGESMMFWEIEGIQEKDKTRRKEEL